MGYILLGSLAFLIAFFFDLAALKGITYLKQATGLVFASLFGFVLLMVCLKTEKLPRIVPSPHTFVQNGGAALAGCR